ncbi:MAG: NrfD/PsrC family molybdoenzyme membrane anchor subunit [Candidatus Palauibacterales bacterium]|nr:NrfD/PsrC family molybdoenzyme membrane anchor subunit [Candidatus Palauibacterales bacterium]
MATAETDVEVEAGYEDKALADANRDILRPISAPSWRYWALLGLVLAGVAWGGYAWWVQIDEGLGVAGITHPVMWGVYITLFVFWVGIAHSGTLISAILYLFRSGWRTTINRAAEAMTIFAVMTAGLFPLIHLGRVWYFYYLLPYPSQRMIWPNFSSPLVWDTFAVGTYFTISLLFWYTGLIPDIAALRDKFRGWKNKLYGALSLGWEGTVEEWRHYRRAYLYMAGIATPLVLSVHSVVSWDFAMAVTPGWHSTIFAPYFVAGAIFSGIAMVITIMVPLRWAFGLEDYVTEYHFGNMAKMLLLTSLIVGYSYAAEYFLAWYTDHPIEQASFLWRATGGYSLPFWIMVFCNVVVPAALWFRKVRTSIPALFAISIFVNIGMFYERFVIIVTSLAHEFEPAAWGMYQPSWVEISILGGSFAWFFLWFLLFSKTLPTISIAEVKEHIAHAQGGHHE